MAGRGKQNSYVELALAVMVLQDKKGTSMYLKVLESVFKYFQATSSTFKYCTKNNFTAALIVYIETLAESYSY